MSRQPKARAKVLEAARRIVETRGAGHLTFEELVEESGITRGGITYHFPTKQALLKGLIEADIADWEQTAEKLESSCGGCSRTAELMGQIRCNLATQDAGHQRFVSGLMSAAMVDPSLLDPIREHQRRKFSTWRWDEDDLMRYVMLLAAEGLFWQEFFDLNPTPPGVREKLVALIERIAQQPESTPPRTE